MVRFPTPAIVAVPIVSPTSFAARSPFVVPEDGRNLNRCFPGDPQGSFTEVLAHHVFTEFVAGSDVLIDLHGGDMVEALEPFALYDDSPVRASAERLARAFGFRYVVCDATDTLGGTTSAAAAAAGIPGFIAEAGVRGCSSRPRSGDISEDYGARSGLRACSTAPPIRRPPRSSLSSGLRTPTAGWWQPAVDVGKRVEAGDRLGTVRWIRRCTRGNHRPRGRRSALSHLESGRAGRRLAARARSAPSRLLSARETDLRSSDVSVVTRCREE
jgi:predicted deacylase